MSTTSAESPDTLPPIYSTDDLKGWIRRKLGEPVWHVELTQQQTLDAINDALAMYSLYRPKMRYSGVAMQNNQYRYFEGQDMGFGVVDVQFLPPNPIPQFLFLGNFIEPSPIIRTGIDEYDMYLRWRVTWMRVTSVRSDWLYDDDAKVLYIHNPLANYQAGVFYMMPYTRTENLDLTGRMWVRDYALARAQVVYGEIFSKFSGAIPAPVQQITLDQGKRAHGTEAVRALEEKLHRMQWGAGGGLHID